ncbi:hypothetical protein [Nitrobacter winogradskyi]|uniref:Uncharacterized protein n=3 Tax=Nitrobacter TaxID=911 RepID=A0A4Y3WCV5_NITWI|nr:hypothetical protein [Nitrobacter winogradskyi]MCP1998278.1 hypothetical protein [Nitrobacter winogradskyi]GEC15890.1 hypothetical protein NWI01_17820 [Nitrobacter winogradskyi]HRO00989.1 hypothetical protein [Nitrobacter sp.]
MEGASEKAFGALGQFPIIQAAVAILILLGGVYMIFKAYMDKSKGPDPMPQWLMMGPLHDMMEAVHDIAEESRKSNDLLKECRDALLACKSALELIRNESRLR